MILFSLLLSGCTVTRPVFPEGTPGKRIRPPEKIGIVRMDAYLFLRTTGGVLGPHMDYTRRLRSDAAAVLASYLSSQLKKTSVVHPVKPVQKEMNRFSGGRPYVENIIRSISEVHYGRSVRNHLAPYAVPASFRKLRKNGYSHLLFYSTFGTVASGGRIALMMQRMAVYLALGAITVPVLDHGTGYVLVVDLNRNSVSYFNRVVDPRWFTLTKRTELRSMIEYLVHPFVEEVRRTDGSSRRKQEQNGTGLDSSGEP